MKITSIAGKPVNHESPFLIAEAGVNHEGSLDKAFEMIEAAAGSGADMIKFQSYKAETIASKNSPAYWDQDKESTNSQYKLFKKYDSFEDDDYLKMAEHCKKNNILFSATPFDEHFADSLEPLMPVYKIASADITNKPLLVQIARKGKPVLISTGASYLSEIEEAVRLLESSGATEVAILHCILEYPTPAKHANLNAIPYLEKVFPDHTIGWSDHVSLDDRTFSLFSAWILGAIILEKHFTLDKSLPGNDHYHAMDPDDIREFREKQVTYQEMLGASRKTVLASEAGARKYARRSLVAKKTIPKGAEIKADMLIAKRPGTGISPTHIDLLIGKRSLVEIDEDTVLEWDLFMTTGIS